MSEIDNLSDWNVTINHEECKSFDRTSAVNLIRKKPITRPVHDLNKNDIVEKTNGEHSSGCNNDLEHDSPYINRSSVSSISATLDDDFIHSRIRYYLSTENTEKSDFEKKSGDFSFKDSIDKVSASEGSFRDAGLSFCSDPDLTDWSILGKIERLRSMSLASNIAIGEELESSNIRKNADISSLKNLHKELLKEEGSSDWDQEELKHVVDQFPEFVCDRNSKYGSKKGSSIRPQSLSSSDSSIKYKSKSKLHSNKNESRDAHSSSSTEGLLSDDVIRTPDDLNTPDPLIDSVFDGELDWESENSTPITPVAPIPTYSAREEFEDNRSWKTVRIGDKDYKLDLKVIEPYKKILSHGGYYGDGLNALVIFTGCYLPDKSRRDYHYVMDNLFLYVINTLELLVVEDYMIVYFHGTTHKNRTPGLRWLKRCYEMIDRRLRKNLKGLLIVHPTIWFKTVMLMIKPFISAKFAAKIHYVKNLESLKDMVPTEQIYIPDEIKKYDSSVTKSSTTPPGFL